MSVCKLNLNDAVTTFVYTANPNNQAPCFRCHRILLRFAPLPFYPHHSGLFADDQLSIDSKNDLIEDG